MDIETKQRIVATACVGAFAIAILLIWKRKAAIEFGKKFETSETVLAFSEFGFTISSTAIAAANKVWEFQFAARPLWTSLVLAGTILTGFLAYYAKWLRDRVKDRDKERAESTALELRSTTTRLDRHKRISNQISGLVDKKIKRVRETVKKPLTTIDDLIVQENRETQVHTILRSIFDFFLFDLQSTRPGGQMRIYLYLPEELPEPHMQIFYMWNGNDNHCVTPPPDSMKLMSPAGISSEIVKTYHAHGNAVLSLVPNCLGAGFRKLHPNQDDYLKSMLSFKYKYQKNGTEAAMVLSLDCDEPEFFSNDRYQEITEFLVEMLKRFEYEMLGLEIVAKLQPAPAHE